MISIFLGLTAVNLLLMAGTFMVGLQLGKGSIPQDTHLLMGVASGLVCLFNHVVVFTYFMGTCKWFLAASDKADLPMARFALPAQERKTKALRLVMLAISAVMLAMIAGAGADRTIGSLWSGQIHMILAALAWSINLLAAVFQAKLIVAQSDHLSQAATIVHQMPSVET